MDSDRELLMLVAKAAGLPVEFGDGAVNGYWPCGRDSDGDVVAWWNPLIDDGDALRLAVNLELSIMTANTGKPTAYSAAETLDDRGWIEMHRVHNGDANAATRRAIVRAVAAIGKESKE